MSKPMIHGIVPPLVTPLDDQRQLDLAGLERLVERLIEGRVHGLFVLGTTGEGPSLTQTMQQQVVSAVCDQTAGRLPVLVGITNTVASQSLEMAEAAYAAGATAVVLAPPYYLSMTQSELTHYIESLVDRLPLPVMLYNMPSCCKVWFEAETVVRLSELPSVLGLKDSSGDLEYLQNVIQAVGDRPDFSFLVGPEEMLVAAVQQGAHGGVNGGANMFPRLYSEMYRLASEADLVEAERLQQIVQSISDTIYAVSDGPSRIIKGIKTTLRLLGVCHDEMAEPFTAHTREARQQIEAALLELHGELSPFAHFSLQDVSLD